MALNTMLVIYYMAGYWRSAFKGMDKDNKNRVLEDNIDEI